MHAFCRTGALQLKGIAAPVTAHEVLWRAVDAPPLPLQTSLAGGVPPRTLTNAVYDQTEGNPFFIQELLRHLTEAGTVAALPAAGVPESVRDVIGRTAAKGRRAVPHASCHPTGAGHRIDAGRRS